MGEIVLSMAQSDTTSVSNYFIDEYMIQANESQIKIYLYLLRRLCSKLPVSVSSIADTFNYTESDVVRAFNYWGRMGLLTISMDTEGQITGIAFNEVKSSTATAPKKEASVPNNSAPGETTPFYSMEQLNAFKNRDDIQQLIFMTQRYMKRPLSVSELNTLLRLHDSLHFPVSLLEYLVEYCIDGGHCNMRYIESVGISWAEKGIKTLDAAKAMGKDSPYRKETYAILRTMGIRRDILDSDVSYVTKWLDEYGFRLELIQEACRRTIATISNPSFNYTDSILRSWKEKGIFTIDGVNAADDSFHQNNARNQRNEAKKNEPAKCGNTSRFNNFHQRDTDYDALAMELAEI